MTEDKVLVLRFGKDADPVCMQMDEIVSGAFMKGSISLQYDL